MKSSKKVSRKRTIRTTWAGDGFRVCYGKLVPPRGRPDGVSSLFKCVAEQLPAASLEAARKQFRASGLPTKGLYIVHDSLGHARYAGRGNLFGRIRARFRAHPLQLAYYSIYVIEASRHMRELETLLLRAAGPLLLFNTRKRCLDSKPGDIRDYEPGTLYLERRNRRGPRQVVKARPRVKPRRRAARNARVRRA